MDVAQDLSDEEWDMEERRIFGENHVKAGINFSKYDSIEVAPEGGTGREQPIASCLCCKDDGRVDGTCWLDVIRMIMGC